jgi:hypothetical protein
VGRRRKGYFKAHKITENQTAQEEHWLLPKLCRFVQILCKLAMQRWQGALADSLALKLSCQSASALFRYWRSYYLQAARGEGQGLPLSQPPAHSSPLGSLSQRDPPSHPPHWVSTLDCQPRDCHFQLDLSCYLVLLLLPVGQMKK